MSTEKTQELIPMDIQVLAGNHLRKKGATEQDIQDLKKSVENSVKSLLDKINRAKEFDTLPLIYFHKVKPKTDRSSCGYPMPAYFYYIGNVRVCETAYTMALQYFPKAEEVGVNPGVLWDKLRPRSGWAAYAALIVKKNFTKEQKTLVRKLFKDDFVGQKFY